MKNTKRKISLLAASVLALSGMAISCSIPAYPQTNVAPGNNTGLEQIEYKKMEFQPVNATLGQDYMRGVDASEVRALEECGLKFYNSNNAEQDVFKILSEHGVNWIRLRIWNDYTKADTSDWGPFGYNNLARTINMAQRAKKYGMKVLLDFHYSDNWADPGKQKCPAMWSEIDDVATLSDAVASWTVEILKAMNEAGCLPDMIQLGNEMEGGIFRTGSVLKVSISDSATILAAAAKAVRVYNQSIEIMLHMSAGGDSARLNSFYNNFVSKVDCDAVGLSYYPYYNGHKTVESLANNINTIKQNYGKKAVIAEISYGYSTEAWTDSVANTFWTDQEVVSAVNMPNFKGITTRDGKKVIEASLENQAGVIRDVIEKTGAKGSDGIFYWGACYLGIDEKMESSWENQALFDVNGKVLPTLDVLGVKGK